MIKIKPEYLKQIKTILRKNASQYEVWVFGSRVTGKSWEYSDIDIALKSESKIEVEIIESLHDIFGESNLPITVDIIDLNSISDEFRKIIEENYEVIQKKPKI
jgi:predicted nucleotidyltransferase